VADWPFPVVNGLGVGENTGVAVVAARTERRPVSEGRRRAEKQKRPSRRPLLTSLALGALGSGIAWLFLVKAAIEFGRLARDGQDLAWAFTAAASVGATACLLLMFVLGARVLVALGLVSEYKPRRSAGRRTK
jgi:fatty acid desaturase